MDRQNDNHDWEEAVMKELNQLSEYGTFRLPEEWKDLSTLKRIIFDVKFNLRKKGRLVAGSNWTNLEKEDIYSGVLQ